ncbi:MAG TPA: hypothetical protein VF612_04510, partial [Jatrophihabitans sp.]
MVLAEPLGVGAAEPLGTAAGRVGERLADGELLADLEPVADKEPVADLEPVADKEPLAEGEPVAEGEPLADLEPLAEGEPDLELLAELVIFGSPGAEWATGVRLVTVGSLLAGTAPGTIGEPYAPSRPSYTLRTMGAAAEDPVPACSTMPTTTNR